MDVHDSLIVSQATDTMDSGGIFVDEEGDWYYNGAKIIRNEILKLFYENIRLSPEGKFLIQWKGNCCPLNVADTPFVVTRADRVKGGEQDVERIVLQFRHLSRTEPLDPATLEVGKDNVLYCRILDRRFPARFSRPAYYQLAEWIREDPTSGAFYLEIGDGKYTIHSGQ